MAFDLKKLVSDYLNLTVFGTAKSEIQIREETAQGLLKEVLQQSSETQKTFDQAVCLEAKSVFHGWNYWFGGRNSKIVRQVIFQNKEPNCIDPISNRKLVADLLDPEFSKINFRNTFIRSPELESLRTQYLTGKEELASDLTYILDALPDFRTDGAKLKPILFYFLPAKLLTYLGLFGGGVGFGYGAAKTEQAFQELGKIQDEKERKEAKREFARGSFTMLFSALSMVFAARGLETSPKNVVKLPTAAKKPPIQPNRSSTPEDQLTSFRNPAPREDIPVFAQKAEPANDNANVLGAPVSRPSLLSFNRMNGKSTQSNAPILASTPSTQTQSATMSLGEGSAVQIENGTLVCIGNTARAAFTKPQPVEVLPVKPLATPGQLQDGPIRSSVNPLIFLDRDGNHLSHASILNSLYESVLQFVASIPSALAVKMSADRTDNSTSSITEKRGSQDDEVFESLRSRPTRLREEKAYEARYVDKTMIGHYGQTLENLDQVIDQFESVPDLAIGTRITFKTPPTVKQIRRLTKELEFEVAVVEFKKEARWVAEKGMHNNVSSQLSKEAGSNIGLDLHTHWHVPPRPSSNDAAAEVSRSYNPDFTVITGKEGVGIIKRTYSSYPSNASDVLKNDYRLNQLEQIPLQEWEKLQGFLAVHGLDFSFIRWDEIDVGNEGVLFKDTIKKYVLRACSKSSQ